MRWNPTMPTTHKIKLTDLIAAGLTQDIKTLRGKPKPDTFAEQCREQGYRYARCYQCGRLASDIGGIIIDHDPVSVAEQAQLIGWTFDGVKFTCRKCRKDHQH